MFPKFHAQLGGGDFTYSPIIIVGYAAYYLCIKPNFVYQ